MSTTQKIKTALGNNVIKNLLIIIVAAFLLLLLTLLFLHMYTRHNSNVEVPALSGLQVDEARVILRSKKLRLEVVDSIYQKNAVPGAILSQTPKANNKVKEGRDIYVSIYSRNPQQISVPGLVDYSSRQAIALLNSIGFTQISIEKAPSQYEGLVLAVEYQGKVLAAKEKVPAGSQLKLVVGSNGAMSDSVSIDGNFITPPDVDDDTPPLNPPVPVQNNQGKMDNDFF